MSALQTSSRLLCTIPGKEVRTVKSRIRLHTSPFEQKQRPAAIRRRDLLGVASTVSSIFWSSSMLAHADGDHVLLCEQACEDSLKDVDMVTLPSGLRYQDIKVGRGPKPVPGYQVTIHLVGKNQDGLVFQSTLDANNPIDVRVGKEDPNLITGLNEGLLTMKVGGIRRLYIPGELAFPKGLASAPGRPRIPPNSPVVYDVKLVFIPGEDFDPSWLDDEDSSSSQASSSDFDKELAEFEKLLQ